MLVWKRCWMVEVVLKCDEWKVGVLETDGGLGADQGVRYSGVKGALIAKTGEQQRVLVRLWRSQRTRL